MNRYLICPTCGSDDVMKNGMTRRGKQNHKCRDCGRQFVEDPQWRRKGPDTLSKIKLLLLERISLAGIARVMGVCESWLQNYVNQLYAAVEPKVRIMPKAVGKWALVI
jgi:insertion element IS1 protein InsB